MAGKPEGLQGWGPPATSQLCGDSVSVCARSGETGSGALNPLVAHQSNSSKWRRTPSPGWAPVKRGGEKTERIGIFMSVALLLGWQGIF